MIIVDASVLIALAKIGRLNLLRALFEKALCTPEVRAEAMAGGRAVQAPEVVHIERAMDEGWLAETRLTREERALASRLARSTGIGRGEASSIVAARSRDVLLAVDDKEARMLAASFGIRHLGTAGILLQAHRAQALSFAEFEDALKDLSKVLWLSSELETRLLRLAQEAGR
jgi:predicted nucleic acid-binding protein